MYKKIVDKYISDVQDGTIVACKWVKLSIDRHVKDLDRNDLVFNEDAAIKFLKFSALCKYTKGDLAAQGKTIEFTPQQVFRYWVLMGWMNLDGKRRFRKVYFEVARKNGKSEEAAILCAYMLLKDGEFGQEGYCVATRNDQAKLVFLAARQIISKLAQDYSSVKKLVTIGVVNVSVLSTNSKLEPLAANSEKQDGSNPHFVCVDEYHAHQNSDLLEVMQTGMGSRSQPMLFIITTAGFEKQFPCYAEERKVATEVLQGIKTDDSLFSVIYTLDEDDDWKDESVWVKANPNIGITPTMEYMRQQLQQAINQGVSKEIQFKTKNLNIWTNSSMAWISDDNWMKCDQALPDLTGRDCYGGIDLAAKTDMNAFVLIFPPSYEGEPIWILPKFWIPQETIEKKSEIANYKQWQRDTLIIAAGESVTDVRIICKAIMDDYDQYNVKGFAYDPWGAMGLLHLLDDEGIEGLEMRQGFRSMSEPTKEVEALVLSGKLAHGGNPVLRWHCQNIELSIDPADNIKIDKKKSREKVDGMVALVNAFACWTALRGEDNGDSVYNERGVLLL